MKTMKKLVSNKRQPLQRYPVRQLLRRRGYAIDDVEGDDRGGVLRVHLHRLDVQGLPEHLGEWATGE